MLKCRGSDFATGYHDFTITREGFTLYPRLVAADHGAEFEPSLLASGNAALDALLGGGAQRGTSTLAVGPAWQRQIDHRASVRRRRAPRVVTMPRRSFSMKPQEALLTRARHIGLAHQGGNRPGQSHDPPDRSRPKSRRGVRRHRPQIRRAGRARVVIIDSLNGYLNAMPQDNFMAAQLHQLLTYLSNKGVTTFMVIAQSGMIGSPTSPIDASYLADSVVILRYFEHSGSIRKAISVMKKRTGGHEDSIRQLWFDETGIHLSEPLLQLRGVLTGVPVEAASTPPPGHTVASARAL